MATTRQPCCGGVRVCLPYCHAECEAEIERLREALRVAQAFIEGIGTHKASDVHQTVCSALSVVRHALDES